MQFTVYKMSMMVNSPYGFIPYTKYFEFNSDTDFIECVRYITTYVERKYCGIKALKIEEKGD